MTRTYVSFYCILEDYHPRRNKPERLLALARVFKENRLSLYRRLTIFKDEFTGQTII